MGGSVKPSAKPCRTDQLGSTVDSTRSASCAGGCVLLPWARPTHGLVGCPILAGTPTKTRTASSSMMSVRGSAQTGFVNMLLLLPLPLGRRLLQQQRIARNQRSATNDIQRAAPSLCCPQSQRTSVAPAAIMLLDRPSTKPHVHLPPFIRELRQLPATQPWVGGRRCVRSAAARVLRSLLPMAMASIAFSCNWLAGWLANSSQLAIRPSVLLPQQKSRGCRFRQAHASQHWGGATRGLALSVPQSRCSRCGPLAVVAALACGLRH